MNELSIELPILIAATLTLSLGATFAWLALNWFKPKGHRLHRFVWITVLLQGIMLAKFSVELPVLDTKTSRNVASFFDDFQIEHQNENPMTESSTRPSFTENFETNNEFQHVENSIDSGASQSAEFPIENRSSSIQFDLGLFLQRIWLGGILVSLLYVIWSYLAILRCARESKTAPLEWNKQCENICAEAGLSKTIPLLIHNRIGPVLILTPLGYRIVVPFDFWNSMSTTQRAAVLRHEVEHYKRKDIPFSFVAWIIASIHWFNPFAWLAVRQFNAAAEWACDAAATGPEREPSDFARALLSISSANSRHLVGANGVGSSNLKIRIKRLLEGSGRTSRVGNMAITTMAMIILFSGWINLRLITESAIANVATQSRPDDVQLEKNIDDLAKQLSRNGETNQKLINLIQSTSGKIAISNSVADIENDLRNEATKDIVIEFFEKHVDDKFQQLVAQEAQEAKKYIEQLSEVLEDFKNQFAGTSNADKLFLRFLNSKDAATVLYFGELRKQLRPDQQMLMKHLGRFLAQNNEGKLIVRESAKAPLAEKLSAFESADEHIVFLKGELALLGQELMASDELHEKCKKRLIASRGAPFVIAAAFNDPSRLENHITRYLEDVDNFFEDAPDGLMIATNARERLANGMKEMDRLVKKMDRLKKPILEAVKKIDLNAGELENQVGKFLSSDIGLAVLSMQIELEDSDSTSVAERIRAEILQQTDQGLIVRPDRHEEISEFSRRMLKGSRNLRRQLRVVDVRANKIAENKVGDLLNSIESKMILVEKIKQHGQQFQFDGWPTWVETHLEMIDGKYSVKVASKELIEHLINEAAAIEEELSNDDF